MARLIIVALALAAVGTHGIQLQSRPKVPKGAIKVWNPSHLPAGWRLIIPGSRAGSPNPPQIPAGTKWPYKTHNAKREEWGDRLLKATQTTVDKEACGGFVSFGDFTWCAAAMPKETAAAKNPLEPYGPVLAVTKSHRAAMEKLTAGEKYHAITMGIRERDMWSELMSNRYHVPSTLYDCFWAEARGPMAFNNLTATAMGKKTCPQWKEGVCYGAPYDAKKTCIGTKVENSFTAGKNFESLSSVLKDRKPLSTFVKMDIEGSEWDVLEEFLKSEKDMEKIRTLTMEVHFLGFKAGKNTPELEKAMEREVSLMEQLTQKFSLVGSTVQATHEALEQRVRMGWPTNPIEPLVYTTNGFSLEKFTVDLVNKKLL